MNIIDCHAHICPDNLAQRNRDIIKKYSGLTPAYDGSIRQLEAMIEKCSISRVVVNNTVLRPELMSKANDYTASVISNHHNLIGMAWIVPGNPSSADEVRRCKDLGFKGVKIHNSHFRILPSDPRNHEIYENIVECDLPVLFHCGSNPYSSSGGVQFAATRNFLDVIRSYPEMKIILGHLAAYQEDRRDAIDAINASERVVADTALDPERGIDLKDLLEQVGADKLIFGSDYPIRDAKNILNILRSSVDEKTMEKICEANPNRIFFPKS